MSATPQRLRATAGSCGCSSSEVLAKQAADLVLAARHQGAYVPSVIEVDAWPTTTPGLSLVSGGDQALLGRTDPLHVLSCCGRIAACSTGRYRAS